MLFAPGDRPSSHAIDGLARRSGNFAISISPEEDSGPNNWLELLANGLTFDLVGLAPGQSEPLPTPEHLFGLAANFETEGMEAVTISPGPHLLSGGAMVPVVRSLAWLVVQLVELGNVQAINWSAASACSSPHYFCDSVMRWISGGAFPGLGLTALIPLADGSLQSEGLSLFTGQELRLDADLAPDRSEGAKIALRLLHWMVENGRIHKPISLTGPSGEPLLLEPIKEQGIVKARKGTQ